MGPGDELLTAAHVEPIEEIGESNQHEERISDSHDFEEARDFEQVAGLRCMRIYEDIDVGGEEGDRTPEYEPEGIESTGIGEQRNEPDNILRAKDFTGGNENEQ